ncbi:sensor protein BceS [Halobacillus andaensis]|uniref:histidine kinase n=1 Tax=Halobacillus andaensis TaxID=1176239 RepID=A0A917B3V3_HALAA|nr:sensor histidine kinase [Halobacillus andaensis]MBP2004860.1 OmpR family two-component system bacitracin resistance sensor histidine kinase BceS [Halobacillus andaensis]GGF18346.1 sensor protein BceS [Halobacillus andaensis]
MIRVFIKERRSWILLFVVLQLLALLIAYLDPAVPLSSIGYYIFLSSVIFFIFFVIRYHREIHFFKELEEREQDLDVTSLPEANRPFEAIVEKNITEPIETLQQTSSSLHAQMEQEKDDLLAWIHEVKTPLTAMHLIIDRIEDRQLQTQLTHEWLRVHLLLDQQLHQKRMPFIENDLYVEKVEVEPLLFSEINMLRSWCMQKGIGFDVDVAAVTVLSDAKWLGFIIRQLLTNAVKYSKDGSEITITSSEQNGQTTLSISDHGRGIDSRDLPRIFDKGFTSTSQHENKAATGMGLYLARKAASPLRISIDVQSKLGHGSTFTLTFPKANEFIEIQGV